MRGKKILKWTVIVCIFTVVMVAVYSLGVNLKRMHDYSKDVDKSNVLEYVTFVGPVSDINKERVAEVLETQVFDASLNYVVNSGGKIVVVYSEDASVREYLNETYDLGLFKTEYGISGTTIPYRDKLGNLHKVDVFIYASDMGIGELGHEMGHVYDVSHNYISADDEFMKLYENKENISSKANGQAPAFRDYYESNEREYFAEFCKRYLKGQFKRGKNVETDMVLDYFESLGEKVS